MRAERAAERRKRARDEATAGDATCVVSQDAGAPDARVSRTALRARFAAFTAGGAGDPTSSFALSESGQSRAVADELDFMAQGLQSEQLPIVRESLCDLVAAANDVAGASHDAADAILAQFSQLVRGTPRLVLLAPRSH